MRRAAKVDANQAEIVSALRQIGASVVDLSAVGGGLPDLICGYKGVNYMLEIKRSDLPPSKSKLNKIQVEFHENWRGQCCVVRNIDDALISIKALKKECK